MNYKTKVNIGDTYGKLIVTSRFGSNNRSEALWICKCECGGTTTVKSRNLITGQTKSCGCIKTGPEIDHSLIGNKYGKLTVLAFDRISKEDRGAYFVCQCECGNIKSIRRQALRSGQTKTCGCLKRKGYKEITGTIINRIKNNARPRNIKYDLEPKYLHDLFFNKQKKLCALSGIELSLEKKCWTASLDRIDSDSGYIEGNVQWVHKYLNIIKWDFSEKDFLKWIKLIYEYKIHSHESSSKN